MFSSPSKNFNHFAIWLTLTFIVGMFLPRVVAEGMFADGLCYSAIARNMANGQGSLWQPFFSTSFWLPYNSGAVYYENMPLMFLIQSWFFQLFGDYWWVEKLYCCMALGLSVWIIVCIFRKTNPNNQTFAWLPVFFWYTMPIIIWASPNNQMDYTMAVFSLAGVYFALPQANQATIPRSSFLMFHALTSGIFVFLAFLAKGPVGVFPLAVPLLYWVVYRQESIGKALINNTLLLGSFMVCMLLLWQYPPAKHYILQYLEQQLFSAISGKREVAASNATARLYILGQIVVQCLPMLVVIAAVKVLSKSSINVLGNKNFYFWGLLALSASLPIMISPKQHELYLIPAMPYFALSGAVLLLPIVQLWSKKVWPTVGLYQRVIMGVLVGVLLYSATIASKPSREKDVLADMQILAKNIPNGSKIVVCPTMMEDFVVHCYLQRYHHWQLCTDAESTPYALMQNDCEKSYEQGLSQKGFRKVWQGERFGLYQRK